MTRNITMWSLFPLIFIVPAACVAAAAAFVGFLSLLSYYLFHKFISWTRFSSSSYVSMSNRMIGGYGVRLHQHNNNDDDDDFSSFFPASLSLAQFREMLPFSDHCDVFRWFDVSLCRTLRSN